MNNDSFNKKQKKKMKAYVYYLMQQVCLWGHHLILQESELKLVSQENKEKIYSLFNLLEKYPLTYSVKSWLATGWTPGGSKSGIQFFCKLSLYIRITLWQRHL